MPRTLYPRKRRELGGWLAAFSQILVVSSIGWATCGYAQPQAAPATRKDVENPESTSTENELRRLVNQANALELQGDPASLAPIWEKILEIREKVLGPDHPETATSLNNLAVLYANQGAYAKAEPLYLRALAINEKVLGPDHPETATSLNNLAVLYENQSDYAKAEPMYLRALAIREKVLGPNHLSTATSLNNLAEIYINQGVYAKAETLFLRALAIRENALGPAHPDTAASLNNLALLYFNQSAYAKAEPLLLRSLAVNEKTLGPDHPSTALSLNNLAEIYRNQGAYAKAKPLHLRAFAIREKALGPAHPDTAVSLNNLALLYFNQGVYAKAEPYFLRVLAVNEKALGPDHPSTATSLNNLAGLYENQGAYTKAEPLHLRALAIREKALGPTHPDTAVSLNNLALLYFNQSAYTKAEPYFLRALAVIEKALGPDHPSTALVLGNLALLYNKQAAYTKAEPLNLRALAIREAALGRYHPITSASLNNLALMYLNQGAYAKAEPYFLRALAVNEKALGTDHPSTALSLNNLAGLYYVQGFYDKAAPLLRMGIRSNAFFLQRELPLLAESRRRSQQQVLSNSSVAIYSVATRWEEGPSLALFSRFNRHGLLHDIEQRQALLARGSGPQQQLAEQIAGLTNRLAAVNLSITQRQELIQQKSQLEHQLYRLLPVLQPRVVNVDLVAKALPPDGVLVEFQQYQPFDGKQPQYQRWGTPQYVALILWPTGSIQAVQLGEAKPIEEAIVNALSATSQSLDDAPARLAAVTRLVLDPLKPHLANSRQWFLSPDGELNRVPFAALPSPLNPSQTLANDVELRLLTTGRDLLRFQQPASKGNDPLVLANPAFDLRPGQGGSGAAVALAINTGLGQRRSSSADGIRWAALPATTAEGTRIAAILGTKPVTGSEATVKRLRGTVSPRVLHIATHGFFAPGQASKLDERLGGLVESSPMLAGFKGEDPMLRSGLVLAGANQPTADPSDDGLLTASEATGLQLEGTELVVLSACSTGVGDIRTGEGVYGLQRALTVAGARSTLLSLWKVDDAATAAFMEAYYKRLKAGEGRAAALAATQADFRQHANITWRHPYVWAAWQLTGDWRPVQGL